MASYLSYPRVKPTESIRSLFQKVATTNHYEVFFSGFGALKELRGYIRRNEPSVSNHFITRDLGLLCNAAELPATSFATAQIEGNRMGMVEKFAHSRVFTDTSMTFYVDSDYRTLKFFEMWHEFIASGSMTPTGGRADPSHVAYYHRMKYPSEYKIDTMRIQKFNKDHFRSVEYTFLNAFPVNVSSMPVQYDGNSVLECQVTFAYDRYYFGKIASLDRRKPDSTISHAAESDVNPLNTKPPVKLDVIPHKSNTNETTNLDSSGTGDARNYSDAQRVIEQGKDYSWKPSNEHPPGYDPAGVEGGYI